MDIDGTFTGALTGATIKDKRINLDVEVTLDRERAAALIDDDFAGACFDGMHEVVRSHDDGDETVCRFDYATKKPPKWMTCQMHRADLWGTKGDVQPVIKLITAGDDVPAVVVSMRFTVVVGDNAEVIGALGSKVEQKVKIGLAPKNPGLGLRTRRTAG